MLLQRVLILVWDKWLKCFTQVLMIVHKTFPCHFLKPALTVRPDRNAVQVCRQKSGTKTCCFNHSVNVPQSFQQKHSAVFFNNFFHLIRRWTHFLCVPFRKSKYISGSGLGVRSWPVGKSCALIESIILFPEQQPTQKSPRSLSTRHQGSHHCSPLQNP